MADIKNILIVNLHSALNLGDDAIMVATLEGLRRTYPGAKIRIAANDPLSWQKHEGIEVTSSVVTWVGDPRRGNYRYQIHLMSFYFILLFISMLIYRIFDFRLLFGTSEKRRLLNYYYDADIVLGCGGGVYYAERSPSPTTIWSTFALLFPALLKKPVILLPQSIGPIKGALERTLTGYVLKFARFVMLREEISLHNNQSIFSNSIPYTVIPDLAFNLRSIPRNSRKNENQPWKIGVTLLNRSVQNPDFRSQESYENALVQFFNQLHREISFEIHLFNQCTGPKYDQDDRLITKPMLLRLQDQGHNAVMHDRFRDVKEIRGSYQEIDMMIGSRLHTAILTTGVATPVILISYQHKAMGTMKMLGLSEFCIPIDHVDADSLLISTLEILNNYQNVQERIRIAYNLASIQAHQWTSFMAANV